MLRVYASLVSGSVIPEKKNKVIGNEQMLNFNPSSTDQRDFS